MWTSRVTDGEHIFLRFLNNEKDSMGVLMKSPGFFRLILASVDVHRSSFFSIETLALHLPTYCGSTPIILPGMD